MNAIEAGHKRPVVSFSCCTGWWLSQFWRNKMKRRSTRKKQRAVVWHYTIGTHFKSIMDSGVLLTEKQTTPQALRPGHKGCVWFSSDRVWEPTACKGGVDQDGRAVWFSREQTAHLGGGLARVGVRVGWGIEYWPAGKRTLGLHRVEIRALEEYGRGHGGDPSQWYYSTRPIPSSRWVAVERFD